MTLASSAPTSSGICVVMGAAWITKGAGARLGQCIGLFALVIQGHHGGLRTTAEFRNWLDSPDRANAAGEAEARRRAEHTLPVLEPTTVASLPAEVTNDKDRRLSSEFFLRLLFSALVDADYLDTEKHFKPERAERRHVDTDIRTLWERFEADPSGLRQPGLC